MKHLTTILLALLGLFCQAQSTGDYLFTRKKAGVGFVPVWLRPSGTNLIAFDGSGLLTTVDRSTLGGGTVVYMGTDFTTNSTSLVDVTGASVAVDANSTYNVEVIGEWTMSNTSGNVVFSLAVPSGATITAIRSSASADPSFPVVAIAGINSSNGGTANSGIAVANGRASFNILGKLITGGTAGTLQLRLKSSDNAYTAKLYAGLTIKITKVH